MKWEQELHCSRPLQFFLKNKITLEKFDDSVLNTFSKLDDYDIISAMKDWTDHEDFVLRNLSEMLLSQRSIES